jgi:predicted RND superfamily exporter protein
MQAPDGRTRVQVFADGDLRAPGALERFSDAVLGVAPEATGMAVDVVEFGRVVSRSLGQAIATAAAAIALLVFLLWRRLDDTLLALAPLLLAGALTGATMVIAGIPFNFANVVALPLLLGVGVDSAIHLVHRARAGGAGPAGSLLATTTARAVFYSFATTLVSFGNLAFSGHRGIASMGLVLGVGLSLALACNLVVLPALIDWRMRPGAR